MASPDYLAPDGVPTRGTVIVVPGRGEARGVYARFGARLAYDAYRVRVVEPPDASPADVPQLLLIGDATRWPTGVRSCTPPSPSRPRGSRSCTVPTTTC